ncbi:MAG: molecular chaperone DnaK [Firmicutes bacterium]|nr:molecular chaperone DnaK [Bacillota bacterium]
MVDTTTLRQALREEAQEIEGRLAHSGDYGLDVPMNDSVGELSGYDQHPADLGSEMFERAKDIALREHDQLRLQKVRSALSRMDTGEYGICQACKKDIENLRLEAEPAAECCVACEQERDSTWRTDDRPVEEEVLSPPFARTNLDGQDQTGFDGEDTWQVVAGFNNTRDPESSIDDELYYEGGGYVEPIEAISNEEYKRQLP